MKYGFIIDNRRCIGCHACTAACRSEFGTPAGVNRTWVRFIGKDDGGAARRLFTLFRCNHCDRPPCVEICPVRSLFLRPDGIVDFDRERCIGCKACFQACPYDALHVDPETRTAAKCDYCAHRIDKGMEPACVIVCPTRAIVSGDLEDARSEIAQTLSGHPAFPPRPENGTQPKLFYIAGDSPPDGKAESIPANPATAMAGGRSGDRSVEGDGLENAAARRTVDDGPQTLFVPPQFGLPGAGLAVGAAPVSWADALAFRTLGSPQRRVRWDWEMSGLLWSRSIAAGIVLAPLLLILSGQLYARPRLEAGLLIISLLFGTLSASLLMKGLEHPARFASLLLRPQWKSWLVRGVYLLIAFGLLTLLTLALLAGGFAVPTWLKGLLALLSLLVALSSAFLLGQAKGRVLWQGPFLSLRIAVSSVMTGSAAAVVAGLVGDYGLLRPLLLLLEVCIAANLLLLAAELGIAHRLAGPDSAHEVMVSGPLRVPFWSAILLGNLAPLAMVQVTETGLTALPACVLVLLFAFVIDDVWVRAPQLLTPGRASPYG